MLMLDIGLVSSESISCGVMPYDEKDERCGLCGWLKVGAGMPVVDDDGAGEGEGEASDGGAYTGV